MDEKSSRTSMVLQNDLWLFCGRKAYKEIPKSFSGICTLGIVVPLIYKLDNISSLRLRNKRDVNAPIVHYAETAIARAALPPLGVAMNYRDLHRLSNWTEGLFNATIKALKVINQEMSNIREVTLQNRYALDTILASKGGVCGLVLSHCCMYIKDYNLSISTTINEMEAMVKQNPISHPPIPDPWEWLFSWLPDGVWFRHLLLIGLGLVIGFVCICCCIQCVPSLITQCMGWWSSRRTSLGVPRREYVARYTRFRNEIYDSD
ncbi:Hypothetical predicted protein [Podarcis lilfordi]|uniref:Uncharacterized protein n=1 Tax=Podarcis lilfordi TaxID=74358 RepID=A0AA35LN26_9SAUR|nr:Hypothetical predicted protein [Podarcis lilfordi]